MFDSICNLLKSFYWNWLFPIAFYHLLPHKMKTLKKSFIKYFIKCSMFHPYEFLLSIISITHWNQILVCLQDMKLSFAYSYFSSCKLNFQEIIKFSKLIWIYWGGRVWRKYLVTFEQLQSWKSEEKRQNIHRHSHQVNIYDYNLNHHII